MTTQADGRIEIRGRGLLALTAILLFAFSAMVAMPFNISGIVAGFVTSNAAAGMVASIEMAAVAASVLFCARFTAGLPPRQIYLAALSLLALVHLSTLLVTQVEILYVTRLIAGLAAGAVVATVMSIAGRSTTPEATFGVINSCIGVMGMLLALILPRALRLGDWMPLDLRPVDGLYLVYFAFAVLALAFVRRAPVPPAIGPATGEGQTTVALPLHGWLALLGLGLIFFGHALLAVFIVEIGLAVPLSAETIGIVFLFGSGFGVVAPLAAGWLGVRIRAVLPVTVVLLALITTGLFLAQASTPLAFYVAGPFYAMMPIAMMPFVLGALARVDPSGRLAGAHPAFVMLGAAAAPLVGGAIRDAAGDFLGNGLAMAACVLTGSALLARTVLASDRLRQTSTRPPHAITETAD